MTVDERNRERSRLGEQAVDWPPSTLSAVLRSLGTRPYSLLVRRWNWKSALLSSLIRGGIFFGVNVSSGLDAALAAMTTEIFYRAVMAGFFGALTQSFRRIEPAWRGTLGVMVVLPVANHALEFVIHWLRETVNLLTSIGVSVAFSAISTLFHYFVMRRGLLVVGPESDSLSRDLLQMPRAVVAFAAWPVTLLWRTLGLRWRMAPKRRSTRPATAEAGGPGAG